MRRCFIVLTCVTATLALAAGPATAANSYDNIVQLDNSVNTAPAVAASAVVSHDTGTADVTNTNLAYSYSHDCTGCRTVTVAVQAVIIEGNTTKIAPENGAIAVNSNCVSCQTYAYAHQYVFSPRRPIKLDAKTNSRLQAIQSLIRGVANSGEDFPTMNSHLDDLSWAYCYTVQRAVNTGQAVCGAPPFDHRQVDEQE